MKPDDCSLSNAQLARVRAEAKRALQEAGALGKFPTPIADIMAVANVEEVHEDVLNEGFVAKLRAKASNAGQALKSALSKVLGLFHASEGLVFIDRTLLLVKQQFIRLHESAHGFLPWQRGMYAVVEDCEKSLDPDVADGFDREANVFASEVLFQLDTFIEEANSQSFDIFTPVRLSKKYGASVYSSVRQYVSKNHRPCVVLVLNPPELVEATGFVATLRRVASSESFDQRFGAPGWPADFSPNDRIGAMVPFGKGRRASGKRSLPLKDRNGDTVECIAEAFTTGHQVFVLIHVQGELGKVQILMP